MKNYKKGILPCLLLSLSFIQVKSMSDTSLAPLMPAPQINLTLPQPGIVPIQAPTIISPTHSGGSLFGASLLAGAAATLPVLTVYALKWLKDYLANRKDTMNGVKDFEDGCALFALSKSDNSSKKSNNYGGLTVKQQLISAFLASHAANLLLFDLPILSVAFSLSTPLGLLALMGETAYSSIYRIAPLINIYAALKNIKQNASLEDGWNAIKGISNTVGHLSSMKDLFDKSYGRLGLPHPLLAKERDWFMGTINWMNNLLYKK